MYTVFLIIYLLVAICLVLLIMIQHSQGIDIGGGVYNFRGSLGCNANNVSHFMTRLIAILGILFFMFSLLLGNISNKNSCEKSNLTHENSSLQLNNQEMINNE